MNRAEFAVHARRHQVAQLYLQGKVQSEIAKRVGVGQQQVSYDLRALHRIWLEEMAGDLDAKKSIELQRLDSIERAAWEGWERSILPREITLTEATEGGDPSRHPVHKASLRKEGQAGDPRFLQTVQKCVEQRCAILGLGVEQESLKAASGGLAALLEQARQQRGILPGGDLSMAEA